MRSISEAELMQFLRDVEDGSVTLQPNQDPQDVYAGNVSYTASNGWGITVFNDCNEWDYVDRVQTPEGLILDFDAIESMPRAGVYEPSADAAWSRYGIPGYCTFRCKHCGTTLNAIVLRRLPFLCQVCLTEALPGG
jgi:hypothetical protein